VLEKCQRECESRANEEPVYWFRRDQLGGGVAHVLEHGHPSFHCFCAVMHIIERRGQYMKMVHGNDLKPTAWCRARRCT
jgi:hypothetical protein